MKTTTDKAELRSLDACESGYKIFTKAHGDNAATFSQCLESNGWNDTWWLIGAVYDQLSEQQKIDLRLLSCEYALSCVDNFEKEFPDDNRPRLAIEASIAFAKGEISKEDLESARSAARSAAESARSAAWSAVWSARSAESAARSTAWSAWSAESAAESTAWSARSAAWSARSAESAAWSAARSAAWSANTKMLNDLFLRWE